ncbi:thioredoxin [Geothrix limicola]|uniref:Thioredoxin n=1 Tax=Geothrix limicola TaxID=2927978 RepID=A0ABQ5QKF5_9BACT|nr:thioredoxin domain-containing protein [Geothrix limicola]GLH74773.1 thioredoxin [Geothrix limicola]
MTFRSCLIPTISALGFALLVPALQAQTKAPRGAKPAEASLQAQIDALREGQAKLQRDLDELKALLKERSTRVESPATAKPQEILTLNVHGEPFKGSPLARVAILEYSDFDCSFCAKYASEIYPLIDHAYVQGGKVKYFFRDMPSPEHPNALFKARVARCAGEQDKFWEAHDQLFKDQRPFDGEGLARFRQSLGLEEAPFTACINSNRYLDAIQRSAMGASRMQIRGTPAFLIGTLSEDGNILTAKKVFLGAESYEAFRAALEELLTGKAPAQP